MAVVKTYPIPKRISGAYAFCKLPANRFVLQISQIPPNSELRDPSSVVKTLSANYLIFNEPDLEKHANPRRRASVATVRIPGLAMPGRPRVSESGGVMKWTAHGLRGGLGRAVGACEAAPASSVYLTQEDWIATAQERLAMTGRGLRCPLPVVASGSQAIQRHAGKLAISSM